MSYWGSAGIVSAIAAQNARTPARVGARTARLIGSANNAPHACATPSRGGRDGNQNARTRARARCIN